MSLSYSHYSPTRIHTVTKKTLNFVERFLRIEAVGGIVLLIAAVSAIIWANSPFYSSYHSLWHTSLSFSLGEYIFSQNLRFWVNDVLMTLFFLVAGMEIRREVHMGALSDLRQAALPVFAALGGVCIPALVYILFNRNMDSFYGWAIPTATDIAFATGILTLLGRVIPKNIRVILLSLAVIDDLIAVLIIAFFYSESLSLTGFLISVCGILLVLALQRLGLGSARIYILPAFIIWFGLFKAGVHPSLTGVVLGILTPVFPLYLQKASFEKIAKAMGILQKILSNQRKKPNYHHHQRDEKIFSVLQQIHERKKDIIAPIVRMQMVLHSWVIFLVIPLFAFANAGVRFSDINFSEKSSTCIFLGIFLGLVVGKPVGILLISFFAVTLRICRLPSQVSWSGMILIGFLAGIGFTMSVFVAVLAFSKVAWLTASESGVLLGSFVSTVLGLSYGLFYKWKKQY